MAGLPYTSSSSVPSSILAQRDIYFLLDRYSLYASEDKAELYTILV